LKKIDFIKTINQLINQIGAHTAPST